MTYRSLRDDAARLRCRRQRLWPMRRALTRVAAVALAIAACGAAVGCADSQGVTSQDSCAGPYVDSTYSDPIAVGGGGYWYDPGDDGSGGDPTLSDPPPDTGDPNDPGADGSGTDTSGGNGTGDGTGDGTDSSDAVRLHIRTAPILNANNGCFECRLQCNVDAPSSDAPAAASAYGSSATSDRDACHAAVQTLAAWAHAVGHRLASCERLP